MSHVFVWEAQGMVARFYGMLKGRDLAKGLVSISADPRFYEIRYLIVDLSKIAGFDFDDSTRYQVNVALVTTHHLNSRLQGFLVASDEGVALARAVLRGPFASQFFGNAYFKDLPAARMRLELAPEALRTSAPVLH